MKCLIIAAGKGVRLSQRFISKPLIPLLGLTLIERVILAAKKSGITDFFIVTGYKGQLVRDFLDRFAHNKNIEIVHIINDEWQKDNGVSVWKAKDIIKENFILLMSDHIFDESVLLRLSNKKISEDEIMLAVDYNIKTNRLIDMKDVTKVLTEDNYIVDIGKDIKRYNCFDTGIFLCSQAIFPAIEESLREGDSSLSGAIRVLTKQKKVKAFNIRDCWWIDIDSDATLKKAEHKLLSTLIKSTDGPISRYLNRPISIRLTRYFLMVNLSANFISFFSFLLSILGTIFFCLGDYINLIIGAILAQISSVIDGCDGEVARLKFQTTDFGGWFDAVLDRYADAFLLLGLTYHLLLTNSNFSILFIGFFAIIGSFINSYTADKYDGLMKKRLIIGRHYFRIGRDMRIFIIFLGALINQVLLTLLLIAIVMNTENVRRIAMFYKESKDA
jgi:CDP-L-myo-inositol myo-inositolphosphotransferase